MLDETAMSLARKVAGAQDDPVAGLRYAATLRRTYNPTDPNAQDLNDKVRRYAEYALERDPTNRAAKHLLDSLEIPKIDERREPYGIIDQIDQARRDLGQLVDEFRREGHNLRREPLIPVLFVLLSVLEVGIVGYFTNKISGPEAIDRAHSAIVRHYDKNRDGKLDTIEYSAAARDLGLGSDPEKAESNVRRALMVYPTSIVELLESRNIRNGEKK